MPWAKRDVQHADLQMLTINELRGVDPAATLTAYHHVDELLDEVLSALCTAAVRAVLTRLKAVWLAMLARPVASVVDAPNMSSMTVALVACFEASD